MKSRNDSNGIEIRFLVGAISAVLFVLLLNCTAMKTYASESVPAEYQGYYLYKNPQSKYGGVYTGIIKENEVAVGPKYDPYVRPYMLKREYEQMGAEGPYDADMIVLGSIEGWGTRTENWMEESLRRYLLEPIDDSLGDSGVITSGTVIDIGDWHSIVYGVRALYHQPDGSLIVKDYSHRFGGWELDGSPVTLLPVDASELGDKNVYLDVKEEIDQKYWGIYRYKNDEDEQYRTLTGVIKKNTVGVNTNKSTTGRPYLTRNYYGKFGNGAPYDADIICTGFMEGNGKFQQGLYDVLESPANMSHSDYYSFYWGVLYDIRAIYFQEDGSLLVKIFEYSDDKGWYVSAGPYVLEKIEDVVEEDNTSSTTEGEEHQHSFHWEIVDEANEGHDGLEVYRCDCGAVSDQRAITSGSIYSNRILKALENAPIGSAVELDTGNWNCFNQKMIDTIQKRNLSVNVKFKYKGKALGFKITSSDDVKEASSNGFYGFLRLMEIFNRH